MTQRFRVTVTRGKRKSKKKARFKVMLDHGSYCVFDSVMALKMCWCGHKKDARVIARALEEKWG